MAIVRGHWPAGKRRNKIDADLIGRVADVLRKRHTGTRPRGPKVSANGLASAIGVSGRTVRRWLGGEDVPSADHQRRLRRWLKSVE